MKFLKAAPVFCGHVDELVSVTVVNIGKVWMLVRHLGVRVLVRMGLLPIPVKLVIVLVMIFMAVRVTVFQRLMGVQVFMAFCQMQPHTQPHQHAGNPESGGNGFV